MPTDTPPYTTNPASRPLYEQGSTWKVDLSIQEDPDYDLLCPYVKVVMNGYHNDRLVFGSARAMGVATGRYYPDLPVWFKPEGATLVQEAF